MSRQGVLTFLKRLRLAYVAFRNPQPIVEYRKGEWRCYCAGNIVYDTSINPAFVSECTKCGAHRPYLKDGSQDPEAKPKATNGNTRFHSPEVDDATPCLGVFPGMRRYDREREFNQGLWTHTCAHCHGLFVKEES